MSCQCPLCERNLKFETEIKKIRSKRTRAFFEGIYDLLNHAEFDLDMAHAIIDGSWPSADEVIAHKRAQIAAKAETPE